VSLAEAGASAALAGLLFVAVSINLLETDGREPPMATPDPSPTAPSPPQSPAGLGAATARAAALLTGNGPQAIFDQA
jgi:hypothetical protein